MTETTRKLAKDAGQAYLDWIKANRLKQSNVNFQAFMAGWSIHNSHVATAKFFAASKPSVPMPSEGEMRIKAVIDAWDYWVDKRFAENNEGNSFARLTKAMRELANRTVHATS